MPKSTTFSNDIMALIFNATAITNIAQNGGSPLTQLWLALHITDPGIGGSQLEGEGTIYTNYVRVAVDRTAGGWTVASGEAENAALVQFPQCGASGCTAGFISIGTASSGAGKVLYAGPLDDDLVISLNVRPQFDAGSLVAAES
jgi:hypothetical protein